MNSDINFQTAFCTDYERLLHESQNAKEACSNWRAEMNAASAGSIDREVASEMVRLQANYAKAYSRLAQHHRECELCQFVARVAAHQQNYGTMNVSLEETLPA